MMNLREKSTDEGMTLVELLVSMGIFVILAIMVGILVVNGFFMQQRVVNTTVTTGDAQNAFSAISTDIRYSSAFDVSPDGSMLRVRTWVGADGVNGSYVCHGWFYDAAAGVLRRTIDPAETFAATSSNATGWTPYAKNVTGTQVFVAVDSDTVSVDFTVDPPMRGIATEIDNTVTQRSQPDEETSPCF